jgi:hypothetical protein
MIYRGSTGELASLKCTCNATPGLNDFHGLIFIWYNWFWFSFYCHCIFYWSKLKLYFTKLFLLEDDIAKPPMLLQILYLVTSSTATIVRWKKISTKRSFKAPVIERCSTHATRRAFCFLPARSSACEFRGMGIVHQKLQTRFFFEKMNSDIKDG